MPSKKYIVTLSAEERKELKEVISAKICNKEKRLRAYILLKADKACGWSDEKIKDAYGGSISKIECLRKRLVEKGFDAALNRKKSLSCGRSSKIKGDEEAHLIALCCGDAPEGRSRWTLRLLADKLVELEIVDSISHESVRKALKKMNLGSVV